MDAGNNYCLCSRGNLDSALDGLAGGAMDGCDRPGRGLFLFFCILKLRLILAKNSVA